MYGDLVLPFRNPPQWRPQVAASAGRVYVGPQGGFTFVWLGRCRAPVLSKGKQRTVTVPHRNRSIEMKQDRAPSRISHRFPPHQLGGNGSDTCCRNVRGSITFANAPLRPDLGLFLLAFTACVWRVDIHFGRAPDKTDPTTASTSLTCRTLDDIDYCTPCPGSWMSRGIDLRSGRRLS